MKLKELRKLASLHKIKGRSKMNKAQLEVALKPILQAKKSRKRRSVKRKRRSVKKSRKKIKKAAVYCGNNGAATNGKPIGTKHQCLKVCHVPYVRGRFQLLSRLRPLPSRRPVHVYFTTTNN